MKKNPSKKKINQKQNHILKILLFSLNNIIEFMLRAITTYVFIFILMVSSAGFSLDVHYCQDKVYDIGIFSPAKSCCDSNEQALDNHISCDTGNHCDENQSPCPQCNDERISFEKVDNFINATNNINLKPTLLSLFDHRTFHTFTLANHYPRPFHKVLIANASTPITTEVLSVLQQLLL